MRGCFKSLQGSGLCGDSRLTLTLYPIIISHILGRLILHFNITIFTIGKFCLIYLPTHNLILSGKEWFSRQVSPSERR